MVVPLDYIEIPFIFWRANQPKCQSVGCVCIFMNLRGDILSPAMYVCVYVCLLSCVHIVNTQRERERDCRKRKNIRKKEKILNYVNEI